MKKFIMSLFLLPTQLLLASSEERNIALVEKMFSNVSEKLSTKEVDTYFSKDFELFSNRAHLDYTAFIEHLETAFRSVKAITFKKPIPDIFAKGNRVVMRSAIIVNNVHETEFIAIFEIKEGKIFRWWEVTYPSWE